ncbi:hypothetical protein [Streptomyces cinnamoneus]|uniref:hypothetical protein n=1 Tax=Streptomyces cinnamoneus TaxID=53446 RepID=UPI001865A342|nr:hypothetical protein [Streptomyces cinnamoneus]
MRPVGGGGPVPAGTRDRDGPGVPRGRRALLETPAPGRFRYHDLVGVYARAKACAGLAESERLDAVLRTLDYAAASVVSAVRAPIRWAVR